jgi:Sec-independent protein secretion pathway component TatC
MSDRMIRRLGWIIVAVAAAIATPSTDATTLLVCFLAGVALFEIGFLVYRHRRGGR